MTTKLSAEQSKAASEMLGRIDKLAADIQQNHEKWGMPFEAARQVVNHLDKVADDFEVATFGEQSFRTRQVEVIKEAHVVQRDADEGYMTSFENPMQPIQTEADEPYMAAYSDDQSSAVQDGKSTTGRPLAP